MHGMILAAGRGGRMGELTSEIPKPLIKLNGYFLIEYAISALVRANIRDIVINLSYKGHLIREAIGYGERYGASIQYSEEPDALETGGGIFQALSLLGDKPFVVMSGDVVTDFPLQQLPKQLNGLAHLIMVDNPVYHPIGDFTLENGKIKPATARAKTFGSMGVYSPELFADCHPGKFPLKEVLMPAIGRNQITGELYQGIWYNIGTPEELLKATALPALAF